MLFGKEPKGIGFAIATIVARLNHSRKTRTTRLLGSPEQLLSMFQQFAAVMATLDQELIISDPKVVLVTATTTEMLRCPELLLLMGIITISDKLRDVTKAVASIQITSEDSISYQPTVRVRLREMGWRV